MNKAKSRKKNYSSLFRKKYDETFAEFIFQILVTDSIMLISFKSVDSLTGKFFLMFSSGLLAINKTAS